MQQPVYRETSPRSQTARFFIDEQPLLLYCPVGLVYGEMENLCPYCHFLCRSPFPRFDLPAYLPETRTRSCRERATGCQAWRVPTPCRLHRIVPCGGFSRTKPVTTVLGLKTVTSTVYGWNHAQVGIDRFTRTNQYRGYYQRACRI